LGRGNQAAGRLLILLNASHLDQQFVLPPAAPGAQWIVRFDTGFEQPEEIRVVSDHYSLGARSVVLLEA
jgi:hypothetical protein